MFSIRQKLALAFGGMLAILMVVGTLSGMLLSKYSATLEKIFRENYDSIEYGHGMRNVVDDLKDEALASLFENDEQTAVPTDSLARFDRLLDEEKHNITIPDEADVAAQLEKEWLTFRAAYVQLGESKEPLDVRRAVYRNEVAPLARGVDQLAQKIIDLNMSNMVSVDGQVKASTAFAQKTMALLIGTGILLAIILSGLLGRAILKPLQTLTASAHEIERGNLDLAVNVKSRDEIGQLADAFNAMAAKLREFRRSDRARLVRVQRTTEQALNSFPDAVAMVSLDGKVELANEAAQRRFNLHPGTDLANVQLKVLWKIFQQAFQTALPVLPKGYEETIQLFDDEEHFFLPQAVPILGDDRTLVGVTLVLSDVTSLRRLDELKSGLLSVVSHELRTPLTSIRMATHLLAEERVGPLLPKQLELVLAARDDAERLHTIIERLLDMGRIESGRELMELTMVQPDQLVEEAVDLIATSYRDRGVTLVTDVEADLPEVHADRGRVAHVFANLLDNALKYTPSGGSVTLSARADGEFVRFSVKDTGVGIPTEHLPRIFERFYRVPEQERIRGVGLGLAIVKDIVEAHGGRMKVESKLGQGSTFSFTLRADHTEAARA